jgi:methylmalonyl-CoA mutase C-terminal domain/subunit
MEHKKYRVLVAKPGLDGHDRGAKLLAYNLRNAGMEVIYTGLRQRPRQIAEIAMQEDVDLVALSCLSGAHNNLFPKTVRHLRDLGMGDVPVIGGGTIPPADIVLLKDAGIKEIFTSGSSITAIVNYIKNLLKST